MHLKKYQSAYKTHYKEELALEDKEKRPLEKNNSSNKFKSTKAKSEITMLSGLQGSKVQSPQQRLSH